MQPTFVQQLLLLPQILPASAPPALARTAGTCPSAESGASSALEAPAWSFASAGGVFFPFILHTDENDISFLDESRSTYRKWTARR